MRLLVLTVAILVLLPAAAAQTDRVDIRSEEMAVTLGAERATAVALSNPLDEGDTYELSVSTGETHATAALAGGNGTATTETGERITVDISGDATRTVELRVSGAQCTAETCTTSVTVRGRSLETEERFTDTMSVIVRRPRQQYEAPGLTVPYLVAVLLVAVAVVARR